MKILIDHNEPFLLAHGGFQILIEKTAEALRDAGLEVEYLRWWDPEQNGDIIHFFGRANPGSIHFAQAKGMKYVMHELLTSQGSRSKSQLQFQGMANRFLRRMLPPSFRLPLRWDSYKMADAIIASTGWESWIMQTLFDVSPERLHVVPTGVDNVFFGREMGKELSVEGKGFPHHSPIATRHSQPATRHSPPPYLVTVATITERKRVVETAKAAIIAGVPLVVIGKPYSTDDTYFSKFMEVVKNSGGLISYRDDLSAPEDLAPVLKSARGFVLLSTMETQSTAALAAVAAGCPLLLTDLPWARATFGENASYLKSSFVDEAGHRMIAATIGWFHDTAESLPAPPRPASWAEVARQLVEIYKNL